jgi:hypothetical protein
MHVGLGRSQVLRKAYRTQHRRYRRLVAKQEDRTAIDDIAHRIKAGVKTILNDQVELSAQRWYIESFTDEGFESRRHECADAAAMIYGLSHARAREIYDLMMLETRRILYPELKRREPIPPGRLIGTRCTWIVRYSCLMSALEFRKFATLLHNLAPYI